MKAFKKSLILLILLLIASSCKNESTQPEVYSVSGTVQLEGETNHGKVKISLFKPVDLDTTLQNINSKYPGVGVQISQATEFDFHEQTAVYSATSNPDGSWKIENIDPGKYNIVAEKDSFGYRILYEKDTDANIQIILKKAVTWSGLYQENITMPENSFVIVEGNTIIESTYKLIIGYGSTILFKNNARLIIKGSLETTGNNSEFINATQEATNPASSIRLENTQNVTLSGFIIKKLSSGLVISNSDSINTEGCIFRGNNTGIEAFNSSNVHINNILFDYNPTAVRVSTSNCNFSQNLVLKSDDAGYRSEAELGSLIKNNLFIDCNTAIKINPGFGFDQSHLSVIRNDFKNNKLHFTIGVNGLPMANENNLLSVDTYKVITSDLPQGHIHDFTQNYWGTTSIVEINDSIYDKNDDPALLEVDYSNFKTSLINWP